MKSAEVHYEATVQIPEDHKFYQRLADYEGDSYLTEDLIEGGLPEDEAKAEVQSKSTVLNYLDFGGLEYLLKDRYATEALARFLIDRDRDVLLRLNDYAQDRKPRKDDDAKLHEALNWHQRVHRDLRAARRQAKWFEANRRYKEFLDLVSDGVPPKDAPPGPEHLHNLLRENLKREDLRDLILPKLPNSEIRLTRLAAVIASKITGVPQPIIENSISLTK